VTLELAFEVLLVAIGVVLFATDTRRPLWLRGLLSFHGLWWCAAFQYALWLGETSRSFAPVQSNPGWQLFYALLAIGTVLAVVSLILFRGSRAMWALYVPSVLFALDLWFVGTLAITHDGP